MDEPFEPWPDLHSCVHNRIVGMMAIPSGVLHFLTCECGDVVVKFEEKDSDTQQRP